jgi:hypothetical protein
MWKWVKKILWCCTIILPLWAGLCLLCRGLLFLVTWPFKLIFGGGVKGRVKKLLTLDYDGFLRCVKKSTRHYGWEDDVELMCKKYNIPEPQMTRIFRHHFFSEGHWTLKNVMKA